MVKVLRTFRDAPSGRVVRHGDEIEATPSRHEELAANGLVEPPTRSGKAADPHPDKMEAAPVNKAITVDPVPSARRGPGRPPGSKSARR